MSVCSSDSDEEYVEKTTKPVFDLKRFAKTEPAEPAFDFKSFNAKTEPAKPAVQTPVKSPVRPAAPTPVKPPVRPAAPTPVKLPQTPVRPVEDESSESDIDEDSSCDDCSTTSERGRVMEFAEMCTQHMEDLPDAIRYLFEKRDEAHMVSSLISADIERDADRIDFTFDVAKQIENDHKHTLAKFADAVYTLRHMRYYSDSLCMIPQDAREKMDEPKPECKRSWVAIAAIGAFSAWYTYFA